METITLQTPWRRGDGKKCKEPGLYAYRLREKGRAYVGYFDECNHLSSNADYAGPLTFSIPEPLPEPLQVPGFPNASADWFGRGVVGGCPVFVCETHDAISRLTVSYPDQRRCIEAFNAAAKVLGAE